LLDGVTTAVFGSAIADVGAAIPGSLSVHLEGVVTNDKVQLYISNKKDHAAASEVQFGSDLTADGVTEVTTPSRWLRAKLSDITGGGTVYAWASWVDLV